MHLFEFAATAIAIASLTCGCLGSKTAGPAPPALGQARSAAVGPGSSGPRQIPPAAAPGAGEPAAARPDGPAIECNRPDRFGPVQLTPEQYDTGRYGAHVRKLADLHTSKEQPVEICGVAGQQRFLRAAECADGSHPLGSWQAVREAREGSVGPGGRCGSIIDLYAVPCPETTYRVYMDMYFCPEGHDGLH